MKKVVNKCRVWMNAMIAAVLGLFGVTSCIAPPVMYGPAMPADTIEVEGEVTNEEGKPLESMQVVINTARVRMNDTIYTNAEGEIERHYYGGVPQTANDTLLVEVNDTTGVYESEKVAVPFTEMTKENESDWEREYSVDIKVQLKKK